MRGEAKLSFGEAGDGKDETKTPPEKISVTFKSKSIRNSINFGNVNISALHTQKLWGNSPEGN